MTCWPMVSEADGGATAIAVMAGSAATETEDCAVCPVTVVAVIVALPAPTAVTLHVLPFSVVVATATLLDAHRSADGSGAPPLIAIVSTPVAFGRRVRTLGVSITITGARTVTVD